MGGCHSWDLSFSWPVYLCQQEHLLFCYYCFAKEAQEMSLKSIQFVTFKPWKSCGIKKTVIEVQIAMSDEYSGKFWQRQY